MLPFSVREKFASCLISYLLQLLVEEYLHETNINSNIFNLYFSCIEKAFEEERNGNRKEMVEVFKHANIRL